MRIQLVNAPMRNVGLKGGEIVSTMWPPYGLMCLGSYLESRWRKDESKAFLRSIKITDGILLGAEETGRRILAFKPHVLGVTFLTPNATGAYDLIHQIREQLPETLIVCGGVHASAMPEEVLQRSAADIVVIGEGEETFWKIIEHHLTHGKVPRGIPGTAHKVHGEGTAAAHRSRSPLPGSSERHHGSVVQNPGCKPLDLDTLSLPGTEHLEDAGAYKGFRYKRKTREQLVMSTRGCPYDCTFCANVVWKAEKPHFRLRSPAAYVDELERLVRNHGMQEFFDMADEFNCSLPWAIEVCREMVRRDLKIWWKCQLRADRVTDELAAALKASGCWYVHLGAESGNQKVLDGIGKKITLDQVRESCRVLRKHGIKVNTLFMLYNIWEEDGRLRFESTEDCGNTLHFMKELLRSDLATTIGVALTTPYPGSRLYGIARRHGIIKGEMQGHWERWNQVWSVAVRLPGVAEEEMHKLKAAAAGLQARYLYKLLFMINLGNLRDLFIAKGLGLLRVKGGLLSAALKRRIRKAAGTL